MAGYFETPLHDYQQWHNNISDAFNAAQNAVSGGLNGNNRTPTSSGESGTSAYDKFLETLDQLSGKDWERQLELMEKEHAFSAREAEKLREWQQGLSDTAIQRAVADAKLAGLNPYAVMHSAQQASTPSGGMAQSGTRSSVQSGANSARMISSLISAVGDLLETVADNLLPDFSVSKVFKKR